MVMSNDITAAGSLIQIISQSRQNALKNTQERYSGIAMLLKDKYGEMEIFTSCPEDEMIMMDFYGKHIYQAS